MGAAPMPEARCGIEHTSTATAAGAKNDLTGNASAVAA